MSLTSNLNFKDLLDSSSQPNKIHTFDEYITYFVSQTTNNRKSPTLGSGPTLRGKQEVSNGLGTLRVLHKYQQLWNLKFVRL